MERFKYIVEKCGGDTDELEIRIWDTKSDNLFVYCSYYSGVSKNSLKSAGYNIVDLLNEKAKTLDLDTARKIARLSFVVAGHFSRNICEGF